MKPAVNQKIFKQVGTYNFPIPDSVAIIQPYVFPYIGYFQLLYSVEKVVFYDDVNFIKRGWINRNKILMHQSDFMFTIPLQKASQNKLINEVELADSKLFIQKFRQQLQSAYQKAPFYSEVIEVIESVFDAEYQNIGDLAIASILSVCNYLDIELQWMKSSQEFHETFGQEKADRLISISKKIGADNYLNPIGGKQLYEKEYFKNQEIELGFIQTGNVSYKQFKNEFVPYLSIIDVLMFNDVDRVKNLLNKFDIV
jgi:hypothetical protein